MAVQEDFATSSVLGRGAGVAVFVFVFIQTVSVCHQSYHEFCHKIVLSIWMEFCNFLINRATLIDTTHINHFLNSAVQIVLLCGCTGRIRTSRCAERDPQCIQNVNIVTALAGLNLSLPVN